MQTADWQKLQARAIRDPETLLQRLHLPLELLPAARRAAADFPLRVPEGFVARMERGNPADPLLRQVLPLADELEAVTGFALDPVGDRAAKAAPGLLHKYRGRVLVVTTGACGIHCRYCFRRHYPYSEDTQEAGRWAQTLTYLRDHPEVDEVILSGGDPLTLTDQRLRPWLEQLAALPQLQRLRIHSRQPVVLPERITPALVAALAGTRLQVVLVLHANHPNELDATVASALAPLRAAGVTLLNQAVLLRGINDDIETLTELSQRLFAMGVLPYYLHQLDRVQGAAHFEVDDTTALGLVAALRARLPGYLVPRLVREVEGATAKLPLEQTRPQGQATPAGEPG